MRSETVVAGKELKIGVIGGGIAGLATAHALLRRGAARVELFEAMPELASHSSGRSAGIWLPSEQEDEAPFWTRRSVELLRDLFGNDSWIERVGAYKVASSPEALKTHLRALDAAGCPARWCSAAELGRALPWLPARMRQAGLHAPEAGTLDCGAILGRLGRASEALGLKIHRALKVEAVVAGSGRRWDLRDRSGSLGSFDWVVDASGAWGSRLFAPLGWKRNIRPLRRHILKADAPPADELGGSIVWAEEPEFYLRPAPGGGLWMSPCDVQEVEPGCVQVASEALEGWVKLDCGILPGAKGHEIWSGTRNQTEDGRILRGPIPQMPGLACLLGLAGRGMTVGVGVADNCAQAILAAS